MSGTGEAVNNVWYICLTNLKAEDSACVNAEARLKGKGEQASERADEEERGAAIGREDGEKGEKGKRGKRRLDHD